VDIVGGGAVTEVADGRGKKEGIKQISVKN